MTKLADELWEKYSTQGIGQNTLHKFQFTAAITEAMQAARKRDVELLRAESERLKQIGTYESDAEYLLNLAAAIEREPLP